MLQFGWEDGHGMDLRARPRLRRLDEGRSEQNERGAEEGCPLADLSDVDIPQACVFDPPRISCSCPEKKGNDGNDHCLKMRPSTVLGLRRDATEQNQYHKADDQRCESRSAENRNAGAVDRERLCRKERDQLVVVIRITAPAPAIGVGEIPRAVDALAGSSRNAPRRMLAMLALLQASEGRATRHNGIEEGSSVRHYSAPFSAREILAPGCRRVRGVAVVDHSHPVRDDCRYS